MLSLLIFVLIFVDQMKVILDLDLWFRFKLDVDLCIRSRLDLDMWIKSRCGLDLD